jgi:hypothetical protein
MSVARHHADWLSLVESSGPFLSLPVLMRVFPQGLDPRDPEQAKQLRLAYEEWQENPGLAGKQRAWVMHVLTQTLQYPKELLAEGQTLPPGLTVTMAEYGETLRPELAVVRPMGSELAGKPQLLINLYPSEQSLDKPVAGKHWKATPGTRMMELLHATDVPLGLVTNGEQWMLVFAPRGETTGFTSWLTALWIDEHITLRAFHSLLSTRRFFGVAQADRLFALLQESAKDQQEVTNQLGDQVRDAVEVLIQAFDGLDQDSGRILLKGLDEKSLYDAALTVMMRLVFLFSAEERGLLHLGERLYDDNYAVSTLREQLQEVADHYGEEVLERRSDAWARLLATFRAVHAGVSHQDLMLPAYGGSLFDPDRYPFLEGRAQQTRWQTKSAEPLEINNRVVLHLLKSLQMLQVRVPGGGPVEARRVSFRALDIEQIGHIYEGLLDHTAVRAKEVILGLAASRKKPVASMALSELEALRQQDESKLIETLEEETDRSAKALEKALKNGGEPEDFHKVLVACAQDKELAERIIQFRGLLRQDSFARLVVVLPGGIYVGQGSARRSTGTHYTPRSLTEPIVQHTLEPLVFLGPAEGLTKEQWRLRSPKEILDLKVCDMAMGSGAFLVQSCRYLSERLVEAWESLEKEHPGEVLITPEGGFSRGEPSERLIPKEAAERLAIARRLVADRCLYGVDINPMAVEMAKLSIWLITVDKSRPFTFLDHALKCGDSLLGICRFRQLESFSLDDEQGEQVIILSNYDELIRDAIAKRRRLEELSSDNATQINCKSELNMEVEERLLRLKLASDLLVHAELAESNDHKRQAGRVRAHLNVANHVDKSNDAFRIFVRTQLDGRRPFHWPLEFPEVYENGGFDAFIGNPPFLHGSRISSTFGDRYQEYLRLITRGVKGKVDLVIYFLRRAAIMVRVGGCLGLILTSKASEGDARTSGFSRLLDEGYSLFRTVPEMAWPGAASVLICMVHFRRGTWSGTRFVAGIAVQSIDSRLEGAEDTAPAHQLTIMADKVYLGAKPDSLGFILTREQAEQLLNKPENRTVIRPYFSGSDLNESPVLEAVRYIIDFSDISLEQAAQFPDLLAIVEKEVWPGRMELKRKAYRERWWQFTEPQLVLFRAIRRLKRTLAVARISKYFGFQFVPPSAVYSDKVVVFISDRWEDWAVLNSDVHQQWALRYATTHATGGTPNYKPTDCGSTFPFPIVSSELATIGERHEQARSSVMLARREGLTKTYNRFHDEKEDSQDFQRLRALQVELDYAIAASYDWTDLVFQHGFHETKQGVRFTIGASARRTVLDRLLKLNYQRYEEQLRSTLDANRANGKRNYRKDKSEKITAQGELL